MNVTIRFNTDNAAFHEGPSGSEAARILRDLAKRIDGENLGKGDCRFCIDSNGNRVGQLKTTRR